MATYFGHCLLVAQGNKGTQFRYFKGGWGSERYGGVKGSKAAVLRQSF